jgi:uncharacterized protein (DUF2062 family)
MAFRRREPTGFSERLRDLFWPRTGFGRSLRYMKLRLLRLSASPHSVATGVAVGTSVAWTPFFGLHLIIAMAIAFVLRANLVAAALGTALANPLTFPFIWASTWELGHTILGHGNAAGVDKDGVLSLLVRFEFTQLWSPVLKPMLVGAIVPAALTAIVSYLCVYTIIRGFRLRKRQQLAQHAANRNFTLGISE